jgi:hypothetical protein
VKRKEVDINGSIIKMDFKTKKYENVDYISLSGYEEKANSCAYGNRPFGVINKGLYLQALCLLRKIM